MLLHVCSIEKSIISQYPAFFTGLGTFAQAYTIKLKPDHKPFALNTPCNIPLPLRSKVQSKPQWMKSMGVIRAHTLVCRNGCGSKGLRNSVDSCEPQATQQNILREVHPVLKVETTLAQLSSVKIFR